MDGRDLTIRVDVDLGALGNGPGENGGEIAELVEAKVDEILTGSTLRVGQTTYTVTGVEADVA